MSKRRNPNPQPTKITLETTSMPPASSLDESPLWSATTKAIVAVVTLVLAALVLLVLGAFRAADVYVAKERVWAVWTAIGGIVVLAGTFFWLKRSPRSQT